MTEQAKPDEVEQLIAAVAQHRQILQGMAVHIQEINGRLVQLEQEFELFIEAVNAGSEEPPPEAPAPTAEQVDENS